MSLLTKIPAQAALLSLLLCALSILPNLICISGTRLPAEGVPEETASTASQSPLKAFYIFSLDQPAQPLF